MDGFELELVCPCGYENFDRVVVQRKPYAPIVTDFVACVGFRAMYWAPQRALDPIRVAAWARPAGDRRTRSELKRAALPLS
jgi:hypothetical protein